jgi:hypothetical protein
MQGWQEGHATVLVVTKVIAEIAEDAGDHVPKLSAYQVRKGVIDLILARQVSQPYTDRMKSAFPKEVEQDIITKLIVRYCQTIPDTPYKSVVHPDDVTLFMLTQEWLQIEWHYILRQRRRTCEVLYILKEKLDRQ